MGCPGIARSEQLVIEEPHVSDNASWCLVFIVALWSLWRGTLARFLLLV